MSLRDHLNLTGVTVTRATVTLDSYGDPITTSATVTLSKAAIWSPSQGDRTVSDKIARTSTHILACEPGEYTWADSDVTISYGGLSYRVTGPADDVGNRGKVTVIGMERIA